MGSVRARWCVCARERGSDGCLVNALYLFDFSGQGSTLGRHREEHRMLFVLFFLSQRLCELRGRSLGFLCTVGSKIVGHVNGLMSTLFITEFSQLVSWCFESSQPQRIKSGLIVRKDLAVKT